MKRRIFHWNGKVFILMKCSSLAALEVIKMTTSSAASDENFVKMTTFLFQCLLQIWSGFDLCPCRFLWNMHFRGALISPPFSFIIKILIHGKPTWKFSWPSITGTLVHGQPGWLKIRRSKDPFFLYNRNHSPWKARKDICITKGGLATVLSYDGNPYT